MLPGVLLEFGIRSRRLNLQVDLRRDFGTLGHSHYPIPWAALKYDTNLGGYRTGITEGQLRDAPEFSDDSWEDRDWEARTHQHYGVPGYWGTGA